MTSTYQLNRISNNFATHKGGFHPLRAHRHPITNSYRVELHRRSTSRPNSLFHFDRQAAQVIVTGHSLSPSISYTDNRAFEVFIRKSDGFKHCASASALSSIRDSTATMLWVKCHSYLQSKYY